MWGWQVSGRSGSLVTYQEECLVSGDKQCECRSMEASVQAMDWPSGPPNFKVRLPYGCSSCVLFHPMLVDIWWCACTCWKRTKRSLRHRRVLRLDRPMASQSRTCWQYVDNKVALPALTSFMHNATQNSAKERQLHFISKGLQLLRLMPCQNCLYHHCIWRR